ncbi:MAG: hypothetical protein ACK6D7_09245, partial [Acidobacteriota bacterium]
MRTELAISGPDGRVAVRGIAWNRSPGPLQIRITANKGQARSGTVSAQYLAEPAAAAKRTQEPAQTVLPQIKIGPGRRKWAALAALIGGAAAGGVAAAANRGARAPAAPRAPPPPAGTLPAVALGPPSRANGKP